ncbi:MAG: 50S ribosomal protein L3 N(5)-glutamine methyltransferase [Proteobacteria bacterium]|nr:50S ribosomal protein L3 N(5)-glutamine methyltransferase [Pseudomonadota bacterium]
MSKADDRCAELLTVRDWLRYAVSRFNAARLVYGHGTERAVDEAAFLILAGLDLDVDELDPWLDARLTMTERARLAGLIDARVATRKPAPYLVGCGYIRGRRFKVDERAIVPRSFIGELLCDRMDVDEGLFPPLPCADPDGRILDLCTGGGSLAILAALAFPDASIDAVDISGDALALAAENVGDYGLVDRVNLVRGDLFAPVGGQRYDLILSNPPYVTGAAVAAFPPEYRAEPVLAHAGGADGLDIVRRILGEAERHLAADGQIVVEIGEGREALEESFPDLPFVWIETETSHGEVFALPAAALRPGAERPATKKGRARRS